MEKRAANDMFVILSDVCLDNEEVNHYLYYFLILFCLSQLNHLTFLSLEKAMGKLEIVLNGFESVDVVPSLFVFMGNFCSHPCNLSFHSFSSLR